jgi:hypothetical protein
LVHFRESDGKIVSVEYWNDSGKFPPGLVRYLTGLNQGQGKLLIHLYNVGSDDEELQISTTAQDKLEDEAFHH